MVSSLHKFETSLVQDTVQPYNYHERTYQVLPPQTNLLQFYLEDTEKFTLEDKMKINPKKTKIMTFNKSRKFDFPPEVHFANKQHGLWGQSQVYGFDPNAGS